VEQNASGGTDHGAAAPMFIFGPKLQQGLVGRHPSLTDLDSGDLKYHIDFRSVYATLLQNWLDAPSKPVLGGQFQTLPILMALAAGGYAPTLARLRRAPARSGGRGSCRAAVAR
jgi:uncharacterized protein (DUF1501 family)